MIDVNKEKREMIEEIIFMENFIYNDMLMNIDNVNYCDLLKKYKELRLIYIIIKEVSYDRNSS